MHYADLIDGNVTESELKAYVAKQAAELSGVSFTSLVKMSLIEHLAEKDD